MAIDDVRTITDAAALSAMANPARSRMLDALAVDGPSTASALAARVGLAVGSASHHLKILDRAGLVEEAPELAKDRRERWWRLTTISTRWDRAEFAHDASAVTAALAAESLALHRQFDRAAEWQAVAAADSGAEQPAFATQSWLTMSPGEVEQFGAELVELVRRWSRREIPDDGVERQTIFTFARAFPSQP